MELDELDRRLIGELIDDGRASYAALATRVGLSPAAVRARVQRLLAEDVITISARIDPRTAGDDIFELAFISVAAPAAEVAAAIGALDEAVFVVCIAGSQGVLAEIRCRNKDHLVTTQDRVRAVPNVVDVESLDVIEYFKQDWSGLATELVHHRTDGSLRTPNPSARELDPIDRRIVIELIADGRASFAELAPIVDLSPAAVRARVQRLLGDGTVVIQTHPVSDILDRGLLAAVLISARGQASVLAEQVSAMAESTLVVVTSGRHQVACELWSRDSHHLLATLDRIRTFDGVGTVECFPYLAIEKELYQVGGLQAGTAVAGGPRDARSAPS